MNRTKRLKLIQFSLFLLGALIIFITYKDNSNLSKNDVVKKKLKKRLISKKM